MTEPHLFDLIYAVIRQVPPGKVATYGQISRIVGRGSAQMVGFALAALAKRNDDLGVPWQRVMNSKGKISLEGIGTNMQRVLLEEEGVEFNLEGEVDLKRFGWDGVPMKIQ